MRAPSRVPAPRWARNAVSRGRRPTIVSLLGAVAVALLTAACTSSSSPGSSSSSSSPASSTTAPAGAGSTVVANGPLTPDGMKAIVLGAMATNTRANAEMSLSVLGSYEAGSAYAIDAAGYTEEATVRSDCDYPPFGFTVLETAVLSTSYPRRFAALGSQVPEPAPAGCKAQSDPCPRADSLFVFEQTAAGAPWKIVLEPSADSGRVVGLASSSAGAGTVPPSDAAAAAHLPAELARALASYETSGRLGSLTQRDFGTSCWVLPDPHVSYAEALEEGIAQRESFSPAADEVAVPLAGGGVVAVFTLSFVTTLEPAEAGGAIDWISDPSSDPVTGLLASGDYGRIVEHGDAEVAVEPTPGGSGFRVIGAYVGVTSASGTRLQSPTTTPGTGSLVSTVVPAGS